MTNATRVLPAHPQEDPQEDLFERAKSALNLSTWAGIPVRNI